MPPGSRTQLELLRPFSFVGIEPTTQAFPWKPFRGDRKIIQEFAVSHGAILYYSTTRRFIVAYTENPMTGYRMNEDVMIIISSLVSIMLTTFHVTSDMALGIDTPGLGMLFVFVPIVVVFLYGTLLLAGRRSGFIIILLGSLLGLVVTYLHLSSPRIGVRAVSSGGFFFIWNLVALATTSLFSIILCARGLWRLQRGKPA
jgi:hypothetical protein